MSPWQREKTTQRRHFVPARDNTPEIGGKVRESDLPPLKSDVKASAANQEADDIQIRAAHLHKRQ